MCHEMENRPALDPGKCLKPRSRYKVHGVLSAEINILQYGRLLRDFRGITRLDWACSPLRIQSSLRHLLDNDCEIHLKHPSNTPRYVRHYSLPLLPCSTAELMSSPIYPRRPSGRPLPTLRASSRAIQAMPSTSDEVVTTVLVSNLHCNRRVPRFLYFR